PLTGAAKIAIDNNLTTVFTVLPVSTTVLKKGEKVKGVSVGEGNKYSQSAGTIGEVEIFEEYGSVVGLSGLAASETSVVLDTMEQVVGLVVKAAPSTLISTVKEDAFIKTNRPFKAWASDININHDFIKGLDALLNKDYKSEIGRASCREEKE